MQTRENKGKKRIRTGWAAVADGRVDQLSIGMIALHQEFRDSSVLESIPIDRSVEQTIPVGSLS